MYDGHQMIINHLATEDATIELSFEFLVEYIKRALTRFSQLNPLFLIFYEMYSGLTSNSQSIKQSKKNILGKNNLH